MDGSGGVVAIGSTRTLKPIRVVFDRLTANGRATRKVCADRGDDHVLRVLMGSGRSCMLQGADLPPMVMLPLRGNVRLIDGESTRVLACGELLVAEAGQCLQAVGRAGSLWLAFVASVPVWRQLFSAIVETPIPEPLLIPATHTADRTLLRAAVRVARHARDASSERDRIGNVMQFATLLADLQSAFDPMIRRCPGRTLAQRRGVFLRLQRVNNWIETSTELNLDIAGFARVANYSPCHFVRTFNAVFGETPHAVLMEQRLRRAFRLINDTELSVTEVARAAGFEDRCAFARSFKRRFGRTATDVRAPVDAVA